MAIDLVYHGMNYRCEVGYQKAEYENNIQPGYYLESAYCVDTACDVTEGIAFDELERIIWKKAKAGEFDK